MVFTIKSQRHKAPWGRTQVLAVLKGEKNLSQDPTKCFPYNRPSAQTCLLTAVFQKQFKKKKGKLKTQCRLRVYFAQDVF